MMNEQAALPGDGKGEFINVEEMWPIYDTLIVSSEMYGKESNADGWFTSFVDMGQEAEHSFFMGRTQANTDLAYTNKLQAESLDFAYQAYSIGCAFFAPSTRGLWSFAPGARLTTPSKSFSQIAHWWEVELPRHCSVQLKVQTDIVAEVPAMACSPGYGPAGGGMSFEHEIPFRDLTEGSENPDYLPVANMAVTQGEPDLRNRLNLVVPSDEGGWEPIGIGRTNTVEIVVKVSQFARNVLKNMIGVTPSYLIGGVNGAPVDPAGYVSWPARFGIQPSLLGKRMVQQRARYHA